MSNLKIREFQQAIINFTNQSDLPIEVKRLCLEDILTQIRTEADKELQKELVRRGEEEQAKKVNDEEGKGGRDGETVQQD